MFNPRTVFSPDETLRFFASIRKDLAIADVFTQKVTAVIDAMIAIGEASGQWSPLKFAVIKPGVKIPGLITPQRHYSFVMIIDCTNIPGIQGQVECGSSPLGPLNIQGAYVHVCKRPGEVDQARVGILLPHTRRPGVDDKYRSYFDAVTADTEQGSEASQQRVISYLSNQLRDHPSSMFNRSLVPAIGEYIDGHEDTVTCPSSLHSQHMRALADLPLLLTGTEATFYECQAV